MGKGNNLMCIGLGEKIKMKLGFSWMDNHGNHPDDEQQHTKKVK